MKDPFCCECVGVCSLLLTSPVSSNIHLHVSSPQVTSTTAPCTTTSSSWQGFRASPCWCSSSCPSSTTSRRPEQEVKGGHTSLPKTCPGTLPPSFTFLAFSRDPQVFPGVLSLLRFYHLTTENFVKCLLNCCAAESIEINHVTLWWHFFFWEFTSVALCSSYALLLRILTIIYRQSLIFGFLDVNTSVFSDGTCLTLWFMTWKLVLL